MYADILINHAYSRKQSSFTYEIPNNLNIEPGSGVIIPFQRSKKAGLVLRTHTNRPEFQTKAIENLLEPNILLQDWQLKLAQWISEYYFCSTFDVFRSMLPKHIWRTPKRTITRKKKAKSTKSSTQHKLTPKQSEIVNSIISEKIPISLIHGITGSGKTEIYKHLIKEKIDKNQQALLLVPEISLTPQLVKYFEGSFPHIAVIHSRISEGKRAEHWKNIHSGKTQLIIGSRSAIFSPFKNLGIIIMDEEHEWSYKQDQSPRYHARDVALKITELTGSQLVFGSATPSIETMHHASTNKYKLFTLPERISGTSLPKVYVADMREELKAKNFTIFSDLLEQKIRSALSKKEQVILFLNRRGSASATICRDCGNAATCPDCDVKLTFHARKLSHQTLICHHCGLICKTPSFCLHCQSPRIRHIGVGTERVETDLQKLFPTAKIYRADRDTMTKKDSYKELHKLLHSREIDILIGTQMIGKGFDIPNVSLVGVILADLGLHIPDFRAAERSFCLLTQVAGRAGRREKRGEVVIQTYSPNHPSIVMTENHDSIRFFEQEIDSRQGSTLPPFGKIVKLAFVHEKQITCDAAASRLKELLTANPENHEIHAAPALIPRMNRKYHWHVLIQGPNPRALIQNLLQNNPNSLDGWRIDVDPVHTV